MMRPLFPVIETNIQKLLHRAKWAYSTRNVPVSKPVGLDRRFDTASAGDVVLARVGKIGSHRRLQTRGGYHSSFFPDDLIVAALGARYATDQFEGTADVTPDAPADLLASGGVIGRVRSPKTGMKAPTRVQILGRLTDGSGRALNLADFALTPKGTDRPDRVIGVIGTAMNAGKTSAASWLIHGCERAGYATAGIKVTGTGSFGDPASYRDAGASCVLDFTDAGLASTYLAPVTVVRSGFDQLLKIAKQDGCEIAVVELADGILQRETAQLLEDPQFTAAFDGFILATTDAMSAMGGLAWLDARGITPLALSGTITQSPLSVAELGQSSQIPVFPRETLGDPAAASALLTRAKTPQSLRIA